MDARARATIKGGLGLAEGEGPLVFEPALAEGTNEFTVLVEDEAGLKGASIVVRVTLGTTASAIEVVEPPNGTRVGTSTVRVTDPRRRRIAPARAPGWRHSRSWQRVACPPRFARAGGASARPRAP